MSQQSPLYIAVEGPIGVGKTTLVERLADRLGARIVLESFEDNPFLSRFYQDKERYAFQTQLFFLMSRFKQQQELAQPDLFKPSMLADYHLFKDRIFAELTLSEDELMLYHRVYRSLATQIVKPSVVVSLSAPTEVLLERIARRGREMERDMPRDYIDDLSAAYRRFFNHYDETPLLLIDNEHLDYARRDEAGQAIIDAIVGRLYHLAAQGGTARETFAMPTQPSLL